MIPKKIHYCWFGGNPLSKEAEKCIESWKKFCPDYEIKKWDESNFDVKQCQYSQEAYDNRKWAFVSDYARYKILSEEGGIYFDTDVELIASIDSIVEKGPFMGIERQFGRQTIKCLVATGLGYGANKDNSMLKEILEYYEKAEYTLSQNVVTITTEILSKRGFKNEDSLQKVQDFTIYPSEYFCPWNNRTGQLEITDNTVSIHHYEGSWISDKEKYAKELQQKMRKYISYKTSGHIAKAVATLKYDGFIEMIKETGKHILRI